MKKKNKQKKKIHIRTNKWRRDTMAYKNHNVWKCLFLVLLLLLVVFYCICTLSQCYIHVCIGVHLHALNKCKVMFSLALVLMLVLVCSCCCFSCYSQHLLYFVSPCKNCCIDRGRMFMCYVRMCVCLCQVRFVWPLHSVLVCFVVCGCVFMFLVSFCRPVAKVVLCEMVFMFISYVWVYWYSFVWH